MMFDHKIFDSCERCGGVYDIEILGKKYLEDTDDEGLKGYYYAFGFIPWPCPYCGEFNNYRK